MSSTTEQIKDRLDIVDVVSSYIKIEPAGKNYKAACPFHSEKTPSFFVSPERESYYCFGCNRSGDIFTFVQEYEGLDFVGALKVLAERAGVELDSYKPNEDDGRDRMYKVMIDAVTFYKTALGKEKKAEEYIIKNRGVSIETKEQFGIGYAQDEWQELYNHLGKKKYTDEEMLRAGLIKKSDSGRLYDAFRSRIMFPVHDTAGRTVAFSGRIFGTDDPALQQSSGQAKYINSPETVIFKKSRVLYGFDMAKTVIRKRGFAIMVEGQFDVILAHQIGYRNTVAPLGTALTQEHLKQLGRLSKNLVLALDADGAGNASATRSAQLALNMGFDVKIARLPDEKDPADVIQEDPELWKKTIKDAQHVIDFLMTLLRDTHEDDRAFRMAVEKEVLPFVASIESKIDQGHFIQKIAEVLNIDEGLVREELVKAEVSVNTVNIEKDEQIIQDVPEDKRSIIERNTVRQLYALIIWKEGGGEITDETRKLRDRLVGLLDGVDTFDDVNIDVPHEKLIFEAELTFSGSDNVDKIAEELFSRLTEESIRNKLNKKMMELKTAEESKDEDMGKKLFQEVQDLSKELESIREGQKI